MNVVVNGILTAYATQGKGKVVVLLHGWGSDLHTFDGLIVELSKNYACLVVDLPGFGGSEPPPAAWGLDEFGLHLQATLQKLGISSPYAVVGHSNGGAVAIRALHAGSLTALRLVLLGSAGIRNKQSARRAALKLVAKTGKLITRPLPSAARTKLRNKLYRAAGSDMLLIPHMHQTFQKTVGQDVQQDAAYLKLPTLLVYGELDDATPPADGQKLAYLIQGSHLEIVPGAGHFVHLDKPAEVGALIKEFLA
jgi:pimeloyl-ACP methyl ester carboxylesterase